MSLTPRVVVVHRRSEYRELLERHATHGQAEFFLRSRGRSIAELVARDERQELALRTAREVAGELRFAQLERGDLDRFVFGPEDIIVAVGQDGLVANVAKYLAGQPVIGVDPDPQRNAGVLVTFPPRPRELSDAIGRVIRGTASVHARAMAEVVLDDGQRLVALNDLYLGDAGHQSSRYTLTVPSGADERQSSSGIIVGTGTGSTGWSASIAHDRGLQERLPDAEAEGLSWFVREAWPSRWTGTSLTSGTLTAGETLTVTVESDRLVAFGDGIERDRIVLSWGQQARISLAPQQLRLVLDRS
ncbi:MAG: hypothetical protein QM675_02545 [Protaetiibacter sp.]